LRNCFDSPASVFRMAPLVMRRVAPIVMVVVLVAWGSGALQALHEHAHALEDRAAALQDHDRDPDHPGEPGKAPFHDESNCEVHAMLRAPIVSAGPVLVIICLGLFVAFLTMIEPPIGSRRVPLRCDCRGPPVR
jgi:hypothetical protein